MTLIELADAINVEVRVRHSPGAVSAWIADLDHTEIGNDGTLTSVCGWGRTPDEALSGVVQQIRGKRLIVAAYGVGRPRQELVVPETLQ